MDLHFIEVNVRASAYTKDVIEGSQANLKAGVEAAQGKLIYCFKILGENRFIAVLDGGVESAVTKLIGAYGDQTEISCSPLRTYETFAKHVLGLTGSLVVRPKKPIPDGQIRLYWCQFNLEYRGKSASELMNIWAREAKSILSLREKGELMFDLFKVAGRREVHMFILVPDSEILDDIIFTLPVMKDLGDQVTVVTKSIVSLIK